MTSDSTQAPVPPPLPGGADLESQAPISGFGGLVDTLLRSPHRLTLNNPDATPSPILRGLFLIIVGGALIYGLVIGTFAGGTQIWAAPLKLMVGVLASALICLPSLYILSCMEGSPARLRDVSKILAGLVALSTVLLLGFAPVAWVFSQSTHSLVAMGTVHLAFWLIATIFGLRFLSAAFRRLNIQGAAALKVWMLVYLLVTLQMSASLRPLLGTSDQLLPTEKKFFVTHWLDSMNETSPNTSRGVSR